VVPLPEEPQIVPSIIAADAARLADHALEVVHAGARAIHIDVTDGHFVPQITVGARTVSASREHLDGFDVLLDIHLLVERPERHVAAFLATECRSVGDAASTIESLVYEPLTQ
jgi:ribulose-phosphate 3-epimerase